MAKSAVINIVAKDTGVQQSLNRTGRKFRNFNRQLRADQKRTQAALAQSRAAVAGLGTQLALIAPELAIIRTAAIATGKALQNLGGPLVKIGVAAAAVAATGLAVFFTRSEIGARKLQFASELLDNQFGSFLDKIQQGRIGDAFAGLVTELADTAEGVVNLVNAMKELEAIQLAGNFTLPFTRLLAQEKKQAYESARLGGASISVQNALKDELLGASQLGVDIKTSEFNAILKVVKENQQLGNVFKLDFGVIERLANNEVVSSGEVRRFFDGYYNLIRANQGDIKARHQAIINYEDLTGEGTAFLGTKSGRRLYEPGEFGESLQIKTINDKYEEIFGTRKSSAFSKGLEALPQVAKDLRKLVAEKTGFIKLPTGITTDTFLRGAPLKSFPIKQNLGPDYSFSDYPGDAGVSFGTSSRAQVPVPQTLSRVFPEVETSVSTRINATGIDLEEEFTNLSNIMQDGLLELTEIGFAEAFQNIFNTEGIDTKLGLQQLGNSVAMQLGDYIQQLGHSLVLAGGAKELIDKGITKLATFLGGAGAIAAGVVAIGIGSAIKAGARNRASQINAVGGGSTAPGGLPNTNLPGGIPINPRGGGGNVNVVNIVLQPGLSNTGQVLLRVIKNADSRNVRITGAGVLP